MAGTIHFKKIRVYITKYTQMSICLLNLVFIAQDRTLFCIAHQMGNTPDLFINVSSSIKSLLFATGNLNHAIDAFASVAQRLEQKSREIEEKERTLRDLDRQLKIIKDELTIKDKMCVARSVGLDKREQLILEKERQWEETEKRLAADAEDIVKINVGMLSNLFFPSYLFFAFISNLFSLTFFYRLGGTKFFTSKSTLRGASYFEPFIANPQTLTEEYLY